MVESEKTGCVLAYMFFNTLAPEKGGGKGRGGGRPFTIVDVHQICSTEQNFVAATQLMIISLVKNISEQKISFRFLKQISKDFAQIEDKFIKQDQRETAKYPDKYYGAGRHHLTEMVQNVLALRKVKNLMTDLFETGFEVAYLQRIKTNPKPEYVVIFDLISNCEAGKKRINHKKRKIVHSPDGDDTMRILTSDYSVLQENMLSSLPIDLPDDLPELQELPEMDYFF